MVNIGREIIEIIVGGLLLVAGFIISFFMVIDIIEKSIPLSIFAFSISFAGLLIGFHGIYGMVVMRRRR